MGKLIFLKHNVLFTSQAIMPTIKYFASSSLFGALYFFFMNYIFQLRFHARKISPWYSSPVFLKEWLSPLYSACLLQLNPHQASLLSSHTICIVSLSYFMLFSCHTCLPQLVLFPPAALCFIHSYLSCPKWKTTFLSSRSLSWSPIAVSFYKDSTHISINCEDSACFLRLILKTLIEQHWLRVQQTEHRGRKRVSCELKS